MYYKSKNHINQTSSNGVLLVVHSSRSLGSFNNEQMREIWKAIPGYEGIYQVSSLCRVKSLERVAKNSRGGCRIVKERILKHGINSSGYYVVDLCLKGNRKTFRVANLVAMAFLNHKPDGFKVVVDHIDNNPLNDRPENLQLISQRDNATKDRKTRTSKYTGVCWHKNVKKWIAQIHLNGKTKYLGYFELETDASKAYQEKLNEILCQY